MVRAKGLGNGRTTSVAKKVALKIKELDKIINSDSDNKDQGIVDLIGPAAVELTVADGKELVPGELNEDAVEARLKLDEDTLRDFVDSATKINKGGRPPMTEVPEELIKGLKFLFERDATVEQACSYLGISRKSYYNLCVRFPSFKEDMEEAREMGSSRMALLAKNTVKSAIVRDPEMAMKYLEKREKENYGNKVDVNHTTDVNKLLELAHKIDADKNPVIEAQVVESLPDISNVAPLEPIAPVVQDAPKVIEPNIIPVNGPLVPQAISALELLNKIPNPV